MINKIEKPIYLYDFQVKRYTHKFPTLMDCLKFLAFNMEEGYYDPKWKYHNKYLNNINMGTDTSICFRTIKAYSETLGYYVYDSESYLIDKLYMFVEDYQRIIDVRLYLKEILFLCETNNVKYINEWKKVSKWYKKYQKNYCKFRFDPVPYTGSGRRGYSSLRQIHTFNERKQNNAIEVKEFVRPKRKNKSLPDSWDDIVRSRSRSWKDCSKKKRQWM